MIATILTSLLVLAGAAPLSQEPIAVATHAAPAVTCIQYVWAYRYCDLPAAVDWARAHGYVPTSGPLHRCHVPEAHGPAWVVYVRPF